MTDVSIFYKSADKGVVPVVLPVIEATSAIQRFPWCWSWTKTGFAALGGNTLSSGNGGGLGASGASVRASDYADSRHAYAQDISNPGPILANS